MERIRRKGQNGRVLRRKVLKFLSFRKPFHCIIFFHTRIIMRKKFWMHKSLEGLQSLALKSCKMTYVAAQKVLDKLVVICDFKNFFYNSTTVI